MGTTGGAVLVAVVLVGSPTLAGAPFAAGHAGPPATGIGDVAADPGVPSGASTGVHDRPRSLGVRVVPSADGSATDGVTGDGGTAGGETGIGVTGDGPTVGPVGGDPIGGVVDAVSDDGDSDGDGGNDGKAGGKSDGSTDGGNDGKASGKSDGSTDGADARNGGGSAADGSAGADDGATADDGSGERGSTDAHGGGSSGPETGGSAGSAGDGSDGKGDGSDHGAGGPRDAGGGGTGSTDGGESEHADVVPSATPAPPTPEPSTERDDDARGTAAVRPVATDRPTATAPGGSVEVVGASITADWVRTGQTTHVRVTVTNPGGRSVTRTLTVTVGGDPVATERVTLAPNEREVVAIPYPAVEGPVAVEGTTAGRVEVGRGGDGGGSWVNERTTRSEGDGFGPRSVALLLALVAFVGRAIRAGRA